MEKEIPRVSYQLSQSAGEGEMPNFNIRNNA